MNNLETFLKFIKDTYPYDYEKLTKDGYVTSNLSWYAKSISNDLYDAIKRLALRTKESKR